MHMYVLRSLKESKVEAWCMDTISNVVTPNRLFVPVLYSLLYYVYIVHAAWRCSASHQLVMLHVLLFSCKATSFSVCLNSILALLRISSVFYLSITILFNSDAIQHIETSVYRRFTTPCNSKSELICGCLGCL